MKIDLLAGDYQPRSVLASCQRRLNLYIEAIDPKQGEPSQVIHYPTPGLRLLGETPNGKSIRGLYRATNGDLYAVAGFDVYYIDPKWSFKAIGTLKTTKKILPVKFTDNGINVLLCDGTPFNGSAINMKTRAELLPLYDPSKGDALTDSSVGWQGSTYLDFQDGFVIANVPGQPTFYLSNNQDIIFDPLQFATKNMSADLLVAALSQHRVLWLIGTLSYEIWYNTGGDTAASGNIFPFAQMQGMAADWGCAAPYSIAKGQTSIFWLAQNPIGEIIVLKGYGYQVSRISTHAIEETLRGYSRIDDCIAYCAMIDGHVWYVMNFPEADASWVFDLSTNAWHQVAWLDDLGIEHRHRSDQCAFAYNTIVVNDHANGKLYALDMEVFNDDGQPIKREIGFPREVEAQSGHRQVFQNFIAEIGSGKTRLPTANTDMTLRWSDDKGTTYNNGLVQSSGSPGQYAKFVKWQRLGVSRNRVFRLTWTTDGMVAIQGAYVNVIPAGS